MERAVHRVAHEALTNVSRALQGSKVGLTLSSMDDEILLDVRDDGVGLDVGSLDGNDTGGLGLRDAAAVTAGRWQPGDRERPGEGTAINASVPAIPDHQDASATHLRQARRAEAGAVGQVL